MGAAYVKPYPSLPPSDGQATALSSRRFAPRVLHITTTIDRGGAENYLMDVIKGQLDAGYEAIGCAYLKGAGYWAARLREQGVQVRDLRMKFYGDPGPLIRLRRLIKHFRPDIIHVHGAPVECYAVPSMIQSKRLSLVITRHEPRRRLFKIPGYELFDRVVSRAAKLIISVSNSVRSADIARRPDLLQKEIVVHHGIDADFCQEENGNRSLVRAQLGAADDDVLIGTIARHTSEKSIDTLLRAFRACLDQVGGQTGLRLALIGRGPLTEELKALATDLEIEPFLTWVPFRDDIPAVMQAFDIFALASREEGFGIVLLEAMSCTRPVVACGVDAIPEIVKDGETGVLVPSRDHLAFASALTRLSLRPEERKRLGEAGRQRVNDHFTIRRMQQQTLEAYERLLAAIQF